jgi:hypothetical protein
MLFVGSIFLLQIPKFCPQYNNLGQMLQQEQLEEETMGPLSVHKLEVFEHNLGVWY